MDGGSSCGLSQLSGLNTEAMEILPPLESTYDQASLLEREFLYELRKYVLLLATLAASVTYQAGLNPPGGVWEDTESEHRPLGKQQSDERATYWESMVRFIAGIMAAVASIWHSMKPRLLEISGYTWYREDLKTSHRKYLLLLGILVASLTYQAGLNPPGGFWEHSRCQRTIKVNDEYELWKRRQTLYSCTILLALVYTFLNLREAQAWSRTLFSCMVAIALVRSLLNLFKAQEAGASRDSGSPSMGSYRDTEPENTSCSDSMAVIDAVAKTTATWLVGSASTHHATGNRALLSNFEAVFDLNILTGDGVPMTVRGRGSVITDTFVIPDVLFVPELKMNIVSVSQLAQLGCSIVFKHDACYISAATDGTTIGKALVGENGMFKLEFLKVQFVKSFVIL